ncbi:MAG: HD domain-containing protein [Pseudomonadota bacterium]
MQQFVDFVLELDKLKAVTRKVKPVGQDRYENSAEHSWQITLFATALAPHAGEPVDVARVVAMLLVHDVGEIDVGDTMVFADVDWAATKRDEYAAVERIFGLLPPASAEPMLALWREFEEGETAEARFANAVDRAMPMLLNLENEGQSWRENGISFERAVRRVEKPIREGCPALWAHLLPRLEAARDRGWFGA